MTPFRAWYNEALTLDLRAVTKLSDLHLSHQAWCEREGHEPLDVRGLRLAFTKAMHRIGKYGVKGVKIKEARLFFPARL